MRVKPNLLYAHPQMLTYGCSHTWCSLLYTHSMMLTPWSSHLNAHTWVSHTWMLTLRCLHLDIHNWMSTPGCSQLDIHTWIPTPRLSLLTETFQVSRRWLVLGQLINHVSAQHWKKNWIHIERESIWRKQNYIETYKLCIYIEKMYFLYIEKVHNFESSHLRKLKLSEVKELT